MAPNPAGWALHCATPCVTVAASSACPLPLQWAEALAVFQQAADWTGLESRKSLWGQFWSAHQRFFKYLCIAAKVHRLVELAREELARDKVSEPGLPAPAPPRAGLTAASLFPACPSWVGSRRSLSQSPAHSRVPALCSAWSSGCSPQAKRVRVRCWTKMTGTWTALSLLPSGCTVLPGVRGSPLGHPLGPGELWEVPAAMGDSWMSISCSACPWLPPSWPRACPCWSNPVLLGSRWPSLVFTGSHWQGRLPVTHSEALSFSQETPRARSGEQEET